MLFDGIKLVEGSEINNLVVQTGTTWPTLATEGELFYMKEGSIVAAEGLYVYDGSTWLAATNDLGAGDVISALGYTPVDKAGDTFTGPVILSGAPSQPLEAATKSYVDSVVGGAASSSQPLDDDLTAIAALDTTGLLRRTGANTWSLDTSTYLTGNQTITFTGDATGSGSTAITLTLANTSVASGSYGTASTVPTVVVDAKGRITSASNTPIAIDASQVSSGTFANARISQASVTQYQTNLSIAESQITDGAILARLAGNETITGTWAFSGAVSGPYPTAGAHLANKDYVDNIAAGINPQRSVKVATTANISLSGLQTIDGYVLQDGDRVLVKDQSTGNLNGVYVAASGVWARSNDFDGSPTTEVSSGALIYVESGTSSGNSSWVLVTPNPITIGTTSLSFSIFSRPGDLVAGAGMTKTGNQFDVGTASSSRIVVNTDSIDLATVGTAGTYRSVTTDAYGRVTSGTNPTTLAGYGITDAQPLDADLTAIATLATNSGFLKKAGANTWTLDTTTYLTGNQSITIYGDASGVGTTSIALTLGNSGVSAGTYRSVTVDTKGRVTAGTNPTTLSGYGIIDAVSKSGDTMTGNLTVPTLITSSQVFVKTSSTYSGNSSAITVAYSGSGSEYGITLVPSTSTSSTNAIGFLSSTSTPGAPVLLGSIRHLSGNAGLDLQGTWTVNGSSFITSANIGSQSVASATTAGNVTGTVAIANGGTGATTAENACDNLGAPRINPSTPKDGDIQVSGSVISIYASGAWRQVFPAVYS